MNWNPETQDSGVMHIFTRTHRRGSAYKLSTLVVRVYTRPNGI